MTQAAVTETNEFTNQFLEYVHTVVMADQTRAADVLLRLPDAGANANMGIVVESGLWKRVGVACRKLSRGSALADIDMPDAGALALREGLDFPDGRTRLVQWRIRGDKMYSMSYTKDGELHFHPAHPMTARLDDAPFPVAFGAAYWWMHAAGVFGGVSLRTTP